MAETPRFSVTVPAYNAASTLAQTVESVLDQTFARWELVIVDDGSTDETLAIARSFAERDQRIRVITQENRGSGGAYNTAVRESQSDLLVMLSADDLLLPDHLSEFDQFIAANDDAAVFTCDGWYEYPDGRREPERQGGRWADAGQATLDELLVACFYGVGAVYRREVWDKVGGFKEDIYAEDYLFWLLALANGFEHRHLPKQLSVHRRGDSQKSADAIRMRQTDIRVLQEVVRADLLEDAQLAVALHVIDRHRRNVRIRRTLKTVLGEDLSARVIDRVRRRGGAVGGDTR